MRRLFLASAAVAALAIGLPPVHAQQAQDNLRERAPAAGAPQAGNQERDRASPRQGRSPGQAAQPQRGTSGDNQMRAGEEGRQRGQMRGDDARGTSGARAQDDDTARGRSERSRSSDQAGERSGERSRDGREQSQRDDARDNRRDRADQERSRTTGERRGQDGARERSTTGQSRDERATESRRSRDDESRRSGDSESRRSGDAARSDRDRDRADRGADRGQDTRRGSVSLSQDQRVRISARFSDRIDRLNVRPLSRSSLSVSVGVVVPSAIRLYDVPVDIVEIYPGFRGHKFVVVEDEIVIIEPRSRRIVTTIARGGERAAARATTGAAPSGSRVRLRDEDRTVIRTVVTRQADCRLEQRLDFSIGFPLPRTVEICEFPAEVLAAVPEVRSYRYVIRGDDIVLVDPDEHRIVEVID
jgi:Protein of unknown function (DUF1236)